MRTRTYARLATYYFLFFFTVSVFTPYFGLFLSARGLSDTEVGMVLSVIPAVGIFVQPLWGLLMDRYGAHKAALLSGMTMVSIVLLAVNLTNSFLWSLGAALLIALFQPSLIPISDSLTVQLVGGSDYGRVRMFGSLGYAFFIVIGSYVIHKFGVISLPILYIATVMCTLPGLILLPKPQISSKIESRFAGLQTLLSNRRFMLVVFFTLIVTTSQAISNNFFTLYFVQLHRPVDSLGIVYSITALSEMPFFFLAGKLMNRFGAQTVFLFATVIYLIRWIVLSFTPATWIIILVQVFNGMSFGLAFAAGIGIASKASSESNRATAQTVYSAVNSGIASIIGSVLGGALLNRFGPSGIYQFSAVLCVVGFVVMYFFNRSTNKHSTSSLGVVEQSESAVL